MVHRIRIRRQGPHNRDRWSKWRYATGNHRIGDGAQRCRGALVLGAPWEKRHDGLLMLLLCAPRNDTGKGGRP
jgi:hypothetical protein